jgi:hypothetical protein
LQITLFAYWKVVYKRYVDSVALTIRRLFLRFIQEDLRSSLLSMAHSNKNWMSVFEETPETTRSRENLKHSVNNLEKALRVIREF